MARALLPHPCLRWDPGLRAALSWTASPSQLQMTEATREPQVTQRNCLAEPSLTAESRGSKHQSHRVWDGLLLSRDAGD